MYRYNIDETGLNILDLGGSVENIYSWIAVLAHHRYSGLNKLTEIRRQAFVRRFMPNIEDADIIKGWRADDKYFYLTRY